jgi:hypothetical protein
MSRNNGWQDIKYYVYKEWDIGYKTNIGLVILFSFGENQTPILALQ